MKKQFNPKSYTGKKRIQKPTGITGISKCWSWDEDIKEYICKSYEVRKPGVSGVQKAHFQSLEACKEWLYGNVQLLETSNSFKTKKFKEIVEHWQEQHFQIVRRSTQKHYRDLLKPLSWFFERHIEEITPNLISSWLVFAKSQDFRNCRYSLRKEVKLLKQILKHYKEYFDHKYELPVLSRHYKNAFIKESPVKCKELSEADFIKFRSELEKMKNGSLYAALATFQYYVVLRISEGKGVCKEDFSFGPSPGDNKVIIRNAMKTSGFKGEGPELGVLKNSKEIGGYKIMILHPEVIAYVKPFVDAVNSGPIFLLEGNPLTKRQAEYRYNKAFEKAGLEQRGTHILRHGSVTEYFSKHGSLGIAKSQLGVKSMKTVETYVKVLQKNADDFMKSVWEAEAANGCKKEEEIKS